MTTQPLNDGFRVLTGAGTVDMKDPHLDSSYNVI